MLFLTGCGDKVSDSNNDEGKKQCKIEVYSAQDDKLLKTIDDQDIVNQLLITNDWETAEGLSADLTPEYKLLVYQEKTLLYGQDPDEERDYELIETVITFQNSQYVQETISDSVVKNMTLPEDVMTFYYKMPDDVKKNFTAIINE